MKAWRRRNLEGPLTAKLKLYSSTSSETASFRLSMLRRNWNWRLLSLQMMMTKSQEKDKSHQFQTNGSKYLSLLVWIPTIRISSMKFLIITRKNGNLSKFKKSQIYLSIFLMTQTIWPLSCIISSHLEDRPSKSNNLHM